MFKPVPGIAISIRNGSAGDWFAGRYKTALSKFRLHPCENEIPECVSN